MEWERTGSWTEVAEEFDHGPIGFRMRALGNSQGNQQPSQYLCMYDVLRIFILCRHFGAFAFSIRGFTPSRCRGWLLATWQHSDCSTSNMTTEKEVRDHVTTLGRLRTYWKQTLGKLNNPSIPNVLYVNPYQFGSRSVHIQIQPPPKFS